ncbi:MAG TPA: hypothetical protein PLZ77_01865 [Lachnospiraceae bacterium]|nr:hypothetical protein [Lachnospiraceae bacterium]
MRNTEALERLIKAGQYQKKAIHALLPASAEGHLEVIERELKAMLLEMVMENISPEMILNLMKTMNSQTSEDEEETEKTFKSTRTKKVSGTTSKKTSTKKVKKVTID